MNEAALSSLSDGRAKLEVCGVFLFLMHLCLQNLASSLFHFWVKGMTWGRELGLAGEEWAMAGTSFQRQPSQSGGSQLRCLVPTASTGVLMGH